MTTAIVGLFGVILGSVLTALLNYFLQRAADRRRWEREDELQRQRWEREDRAGLRAERIGLYRDYVAQVHLARDALGFDADEMRRLMYEIELLGSDEVVTWAVPLFFDTEEVDGQSRVPPPKSKIDQAMSVLDSGLFKFEQAVRSELGIPDPPPRCPSRIESNDDREPGGQR